uniref:Activin_recp domain-containing protein n=1 Tax=Panagrolaimus sp. PS1159 TaxID=55785 RepID=A0AC35FAR3_9BILA
MKYLIFVAIFAFSFQILNALNCISKRNSKCLDSVKYCMYINYMDENGINHIEQSCASPITLGGKIFTCEDYGTTTINFKNINGKMICCDTNMCNDGNDPGTTKMYDKMNFEKQKLFSFLARMVTMMEILLTD